MSDMDEDERDVKRPTQLVLGLGNSLRGDDGVGTAVVEALTGHADLCSDVRVVDGGTPGLDVCILHHQPSSLSNTRIFRLLPKKDGLLSI